MLAEIGAADAMLERGIQVPIWQIRDRVAGLVAEFDLALLKDETPFPYRLHRWRASPSSDMTCRHEVGA